MSLPGCSVLAEFRHVASHLVEYKTARSSLQNKAHRPRGWSPPMTQNALPKYYADLSNIEQNLSIERIYPGCCVRSSLSSHRPLSHCVAAGGQKEVLSPLYVRGVCNESFEGTLC